jgi:hypothetical protein
MFADKDRSMLKAALLTTTALVITDTLALYTCPMQKKKGGSFWLIQTGWNIPKENK